MEEVPRGGVRPADALAAVAFALAVAAALACVAPARAGTDAPAGCPVSIPPPLPLPLHVLDLAFLGPDRLVALDASEVALLALEHGAVRLLGRRALPGPLEVVRAPGGLLLASERDGAVWAITSRSPQAVLFAVEGDQFVERQQAAALPFPHSPRGLRFRPGTNLIEGEVEGLGAGPFLDVAAADGALAVLPDGRLLAAGAADGAPRVGPTLAPLWPGLIAASRPSPPTHDDAVLVLATGGGAPLVSCPAPGPVRAIAARLDEAVARLAVATDDADGRSSLLVIDLSRPARP